MQTKSYKEEFLETFNIHTNEDLKKWLKQNEPLNIAIFTEKSDD